MLLDPIPTHDSVEEREDARPGEEPEVAGDGNSIQKGQVGRIAAIPNPPIQHRTEVVEDHVHHPSIEADAHGFDSARELVPPNRHAHVVEEGCQEHRDIEWHSVVDQHDREFAVPEALHGVVGHNIVQQSKDEGAEQGEQPGEVAVRLGVAPGVENRAHYADGQDELDGEKTPILQLAGGIEADEAINGLAVSHCVRDVIVHLRSILLLRWRGQESPPLLIAPLRYL